MTPLTCPLCGEPALGDGGPHYDGNPWSFLAEHLLDYHGRPNGFCWCGLKSGNWRALGNHYQEIGLENLKSHRLAGRIANL